MLNLKFIALHGRAIKPVAHGADSVCVDLCSADDCQELIPGLVTIVNTGLVLHPDSREDVKELSISLRSSFASNNGVVMPNAPGIIEPSFVGFTRSDSLYGISFALLPLTGPVKILPGQRIGQMRVTGSDGRLLIPNVDYECSIVNYVTTIEDWKSIKGRGGFGSTGK